MEEFKDGQRVRMKTCVSWSGWPGKVLHLQGQQVRGRDRQVALQAEDVPRQP
jgi:hypothetical protein